MVRYKELKYEGKVYNEQYKIDEILIKNKFEWFLDTEVENIRLEIVKDILVVNSGIWYNGIFVYGVIRDLEWRFGSFENGIIHNIIWRNGIFKNGIIYGGIFYQGQFISGEIKREGAKTEFINCDISPNFKQNL